MPGQAVDGPLTSGSKLLPQLLIYRFPPCAAGEMKGAKADRGCCLERQKRVYIWMRER